MQGESAEAHGIARDARRVTSSSLPMHPWKWTDPKATRAFTCVLGQLACIAVEALIWHLIASAGWLEWPAVFLGLPVLMLTLAVAASVLLWLAFFSITSALESLLERREHVVVAYLSLAIELALFAAFAWLFI